jgi:hypothetical protein
MMVSKAKKLGTGKPATAFRKAAFVEFFIQNGGNAADAA